jgi:hypothetical protein
MFRKIYIQLICITKTRIGKLVALWLKATTAGKTWYFCERITANWYNKKHVKLFLFLFGPVNLHSNSWIQQLKKSEWLVGQTVFREDWWQRQRFFFHYQSLITITTIDLSIVNNASQTGRRVAVFHWPAKVWYPCMAWTNFINRPKTSRPWLYLTKHHKMSKQKLCFPDQSSIAKWLIKEKKDIFETLSVPLLDDIKLKSQIINL